jgi:hypothetical protein
MSGGHWNYSDEKLRESGVQAKAIFDLMALIEHELDLVKEATRTQ